MSAVTFRFLLSLLALAALLAAPLGIRGDAAMAMSHDVPHAAASGDCQGMAGGEGAGDEASADCAIACAALPAIAPDAAAEIPLRTSAPVVASLATLHGMRPEAAIPPPRAS